jgi:glycerol-3-phosphate acyltransferase PlsY
VLEAAGQRRRRITTREVNEVVRELALHGAAALSRHTGQSHVRDAGGARPPTFLLFVNHPSAHRCVSALPRERLARGLGLSRLPHPAPHPQQARQEGIVKPGLLLLAAYLIGAFPTSLLVGRLRGIDLRKHGSGNLGATNAFRVLGWKAAAPVFIVDILKGWFPTFFFPRWDGVAATELALAYGAAAIVGHVFSVYVRFKGGKGVATSTGVLLALAPAAVGIGLLLWAGLVYLTGYVSLASIVSALVVPIVIMLFRAGDTLAQDWARAVCRVCAPRQHPPPAARRGAPLSKEGDA